MRTFSSPLVAAVLAALLSACGGGGGGDGTPTEPGGGTPVLTSIAISAPQNTVAIGGTLLLSASPKDQNGAAISASVTWTSSSSSVALVGSTSGLVTGVAAGTATITAASGSVSGSMSITVTSGSPGTFPLSATVTMPGNSFSPFQTDIRVGGTVNFSFPAEPHNVIFSSGAGRPADIQVTANTTVARTFTTAGTFPYVCTLHEGMVGEVVVH